MNPHSNWSSVPSPCIDKNTRASDNRHPECPPRMSDGRMFTDYRPSCVVNNQIRSQLGVSSSLEYRNILTLEASKIMQGERDNVQAGNCKCCSYPNMS